MIKLAFSFAPVPLLAILLFAFPVSASDVDVDVLREKVDAYMSRWDNDTSPGAAVLIARDGEILLKKGYGMADIESKTPVDADTAFHFALASATITRP